MKYFYTLIFIFKFLCLLGQCQNEIAKTEINPTIKDTLSNTNTYIDIQTVTSKINSSNLNVTEKCKYGTVFNGNSCDDCGKNYFRPNLENRIVGGIESKPYSWPAQVFLKIRVSGIFRGQTVYSDYSCGGTLINRFKVLTAGHCVITEIPIEVCYDFFCYDLNIDVKNPFDSTQYTVYLGAYDIKNLNQQPAVQMSVKKVIRHPSFDSINFLNDLAILQLDGEVSFNKYIQPACLPDPNYGIDYPSSYNISTVYASGWGLLSSSSYSISNILYNVQLNSYPPSYCSNVASESRKNWDSQICAGDYSGGKDTCQGDSGDGLYLFDSNLQRYVLVGITSFGEGCAKPGYPGIYTRISYFYDGIIDNSKYDPIVASITSIVSTTISTFTINPTGQATFSFTSTTISTLALNPTGQATFSITSTTISTLAINPTGQATFSITNTGTDIQTVTYSTTSASFQNSYSLFLLISLLIIIGVTKTS